MSENNFFIKNDVEKKVNIQQSPIKTDINAIL